MKKTKKRYVIRYYAIFASGYVQFTWRRKRNGEKINYTDMAQALLHAKKFRCKWVAKLWVNILNKQDYLHSYYIVEI